MMVVRFESLVVGRWIRLWTLMMGERTGEMEFVKHVMEGPVTSNAVRARYGAEALESLVFVFCSRGRPRLCGRY